MYETSHRFRKYQCFFSSGPLHNYNGAYFLEMAHNFGNPGAIGPYACFAFPISAIVPVKVKGRGKNEVVMTYALLDNGSTSIWCTEGLAKRLGVIGPRIQVSLSTIEKDSNPTSCCRVSLEIMDLNEVNMVELPEVLRKEKLNISTDGVSYQEDVERWPNLSGILVPERTSGEVELLIGQDVPEALEPDEIWSLRMHQGPSLVGL